MADGDSSSNPGGRTVLIAMDGSKHALNAFEWYAKNVHKPNDNVIMAHCAEHLALPPTAMMAGNPTAIQQMVKEHEKHVTEVFQKIDNVANKHQIKHTLEKLHGDAGNSVVSAAESQKADMIVCGSRGYGAIRRTILGSVSDYIIHHSRVPVMVCKHEDEHHKLK